MNSITKQNEVSQVKMAQIKSDYWLRLLSNGHQGNGSTGFGRNGHQPGTQVLAPQSMVLAQSPDYWLQLLSGTGQTNHSTNNGRVANMAPQRLGNQQFTPEIWLRMLGAAR